MMKFFKLILLSFFALSLNAYGMEPMNQTKMKEIVTNMVQNAEGSKSYLKFEYKKVKMFLISDASHNRMRIIAPIAQFASLKDEHKQAMLESNFHSSLDARYALSDGIIYSAYIHPMKELTEGQIISAVKQVASLATSFGKSYSSGKLSFGKNSGLVI